MKVLTQEGIAHFFTWRADVHKEPTTVATEDLQRCVLALQSSESFSYSPSETRLTDANGMPQQATFTPLPQWIKTVI